MSSTTSSGPKNAPAREAIAIHLLKLLTTAHGRGRRLSLDDAANVLGARRAEVRAVASALHREGYLDVLRMRPTLQGFALGRALSRRCLVSLRASAELSTRAA